MSVFEYFRPRAIISTENLGKPGLADSSTIRLNEHAPVLIRNESLILPFVLEDFDNLFALRTREDALRVRVAVASDKGAGASAAEFALQPDCRGYSNEDELLQQFNASIKLPLKQVHLKSPIELSVASTGDTIARIGVTGIAPSFVQRLPIGKSNNVVTIPYVAFFSLLLLTLFMVTVFVRDSALFDLILRLGGQLVLFLILTFPYQRYISEIQALGFFLFLALLALPFRWFPSGGEKMAKLLPSTTDIGRSKFLVWISNLIAALALSGFAYLLFSQTSFRWGGFEERDFLAAQEVARLDYFPVMGPQNLAGGQIPGGFLYLFLAPLVKFWADPLALATLTRLSYLLSAILLWWVLKRYAGALPAAFAALFFCSSKTVLAYAHWPIHPSMAIFFYYLFIACCIFFCVERKKPWAIVSSVLLAALVQMHFSYAILILPFALLLVATPLQGKKGLALGCLVGFLILFLPYILFESTHGWSNWALTLAKPRYHPVYVPTSSFFSYRLLDILPNWMDNPISLGSTAITGAAFFFLICGLVTVAYTVLRAGEDEASERPARFSTAIAILFGIPFLFLALYGMGYDYRHTIAFAPMCFTIIGWGIYGFSRLPRYGVRAVCAAMTLTCVAFIFSVGHIKNDIKQIARRAGEWAVDYDERLHVMRFLIRELGITPAQYQRQVFYWCNLGFATDSRLYEAEYKKIRKEGAASQSLSPALQPDEMLLLLSEKEVLPVFKNQFDLQRISKVAGITIFRARFKDGSPPVSNTQNVYKLNPLNAVLETLKAPEGVSRIDIPIGNQLHTGHLVSLHEGRIKLLVQLSQGDAGPKGTKIHWKIDSPHLGGYYQEIKTLWKPALVFRNEISQEVRVVPLVKDVLGSLLMKTPLEGEIRLPGNPSGWHSSLSIEGYFDQSNMDLPVIRLMVWEMGGLG